MNPHPHHHDPPPEQTPTPRLAVAPPPAEADEQLVETVAEHVLQLLAARGHLVPAPERPPTDNQLITATEVALRYRVHRSWVYANARRLGAIRLGRGPKAPLRFEPATVAAAIATLTTRPPRPAAAVREPAPSPATDKPKRGLLPVRDQ